MIKSLTILPAPLRRHSLPGVAWALLCLIAIFSIAANGFFSSTNAWNVGIQATLLIFLALPMTLVIMTEGLDLSIGSVMSLCTVILAIVEMLTGSWLFAGASAIAVGISFGAINGGIIAGTGITPFVATLGTMGIAQGAALVLAEGRELNNISDTLRFAWEGSVVGIPIPIVFAVLVYGLIYVLLHQTRFGSRIIALGGNREALTFAGIRSGKYLVAVYAIAGALAATSAVFLSARINGGNPGAAIGMEFEAIAAVIVGGASFTKGKGSLFGALLGVLTVSVLRNGLNLLEFNSSIQVAAVGLLVIIALVIDSAGTRT